MYVIWSSRGAVHARARTLLYTRARDLLRLLQLTVLHTLLQMEKRQGVDALEDHDSLEEVTITTYKELVPYVVEIVRLIERIFEAGRNKGEEAMMAECLMKLLNSEDTT